MTMKKIETYSLPCMDGSQQSLRDFSNQVLLIVNTATECGFTWQYEQLQQMQEDFHNKGFTVLGIPCNQFMGQAPGSDKDIHDFCVENYHITFPQYRKSEVNGIHELPLYTYLKSQQTFHGFTGEESELMDDLLQEWKPDYKKTSDIKWNFTKFVVDRKGNVIKRFECTEDMDDVRKCIEQTL